ncbi:MAG TPA: GNAT family N-acetyltransferase [Nitratidesulfovibrio sp.]|nr:GNAT family N-acetyltransferase [Nitratidesulfovibrio sp.]
MLIRDAAADDIKGIVVIYNDAVRTTTAIWNESVTDAAGRAVWMADRTAAGYPVLVAVEEGADGGSMVLGYATFGDWRAWDGYRHTVEHSVYVHKDSRGRGIGGALLHALIGRARDMGKHVMVAGVEAGNTASIALHRKFGFSEVGMLREVGCKFGRWLDLAFLQLTLDTRATPPGREGQASALSDLSAVRTAPVLPGETESV